MYVFSLFAFRSLRSLHASRENPKPCEWVGRFFCPPFCFCLVWFCPPFGSFVVFFNRPLKGRKGGNGSGFARAIKGFPFFGSFRAKKRLAAKAQCPYLLSLFPCKGGQVGAYGSVFISLVSFVVIAA